MVSRTSPPHQSISAPVTDTTPLVIAPFADSATTRNIARAKDHSFGCICDCLHRVRSELGTLSDSCLLRRLRIDLLQGFSRRSPNISVFVLEQFAERVHSRFGIRTQLR